MAGVTFLAFGNGSPDVFSTFAAMSTNSGSMAIGELIGAAGFITAVVAGSMALVREFKVGKKSFVRDVGFFIVAASFSMVFLADGHLHFWECCVMIGFYLFYVTVVVSWHWYEQRKRRRRERIALSRGHYQGPAFTEIEVQEENSDEDEDGTTAGAATPRDIGEDFDALERGFNAPNSDDESDGEGKRGRQFATEVSNSMRVIRPTGSRRNTMTPIRPSLVGAMEFRSVLASLQKARGSDAHHIHLRRYSDDRRSGAQRSYDEGLLSTIPSEYGGSVIVTNHDGPTDDSPSTDTPVSRARSASMNDANHADDHRDPAAFTVAQIPSLGLVGAEPTFPPNSNTTDFATGLRRADGAPPSPTLAPPSPTISVTPPGTESSSRATSPAPHVGQRNYENGLAPPEYGFPGAKHLRADVLENEHNAEDPAATSLSPMISPRTDPRPKLGLQVPHYSRESSTTRSPRSPLSNGASAFPTYVDSPLPLNSPHLSLPASQVDGNGELLLGEPMLTATQQERFYVEDCITDHNMKPLSWWPYKYLPPPEVMRSALFPTFDNWAGKSIWDKMLSIVSAPSIFLLAVTLPVVEGEQKEDEEEAELDRAIERRTRSRSGTGGQVFIPSGQTTPYADNGLEPEWLAYRRNSVATPALSFGNPQSANFFQHHQQHLHPDKGLAHHGNTASLAVETEDIHHHNPHSRDLSAAPKNINPAQGYIDPSLGADHKKPEDWNRWLVVVQIFTAPMFVSLILWANMYNDDLPGGKLLEFLLYGMIFSIATFGILLLTTKHDRIPKYRPLLCFLGFIVAIAWISTIASEVVGVLKALGVILGISDAILGLTIFAVGNSLGDLVADITVARLGYPVMALSACFGGPMLNILLGVGVSGAYMTLSDAHKRRDRHQGAHAGHGKLKLRPYEIQISPTLLISAGSLLVTLVALLVAVPMNKWVMGRRIGWGLIGLWCVSTIANLVVEGAGVWGDGGLR